jgi:hypothetical protein
VIAGKTAASGSVVGSDTASRARRSAGPRRPAASVAGESRAAATAAKRAGTVVCTADRVLILHHSFISSVFV